MMQNFFAAAASAGNVPKLEPRRALVVINMQNDTFNNSSGTVICERSGFIDKIGDLVPYYRMIGDVIWVRTEWERPNQDHIDTAVQRLHVTEASQDANEDNDQQMDTSGASYTMYFPTSTTKNVMKRAPPRAREEQRQAQVEAIMDEEDVVGFLPRPQDKKLPQLFRPGSRGVEVMEELLPALDRERDIDIIKHHYSALDATALLLSLRMKLVTHVYLCGCLSNVSIQATAADAVRHGFEVTVVEDCMGFRSEEKHLEAMCQMADTFGVSGITSEELIQEARALEGPPDTEENTFSGPGFEGISGAAKRSHSQERRDATPLQDDAVPMELDEVLDHANEGFASKQKGRRGASRNHLKKTIDTRGSRSPNSSLNSPRLLEVKARMSQQTTLGPGTALGAGDSHTLHHALSPDLSELAFSLLREEVQWQAMRHRNGEVPRRVAVQGTIDVTGIRPIYRHPADESPPLLPWSSTIDRIRKEVETILQQPFNHALIQLYRDGQDNISEHSDKTLDIIRESSVVNVSLGAQRVMTLRTKKSSDGKLPEHTPRQSQRIPMPHNSIFVLGPETNRRWLHGIRADKRRAAEKTEEETSYGGERISITFRQIGTYIDAAGQKIWGQGARSKQQESAGNISTSNSAELDTLIVAFGRENHLSDFNWDAEYGTGFDVVNLVTSTAQIHLSNDRLANLRVLIYLFERNVPCETTPGNSQPTPLSPAKSPTDLARSENDTPIFRDADEGSSEVTGDLEILFYLGKFYPLLPPEGEVAERQIHRETAQVFSRTTQANDVLDLWQRWSGARISESTYTSYAMRHLDLSAQASGEPDGSQLEDLERELQTWEGYAREADFLGGEFFAIVDCAFWPVLDEVVRKWERWDPSRYARLNAYHQRVLGMESVRRAFDTQP